MFVFRPKTKVRYSKFRVGAPRKKKESNSQFFIAETVVQFDQSVFQFREQSDVMCVCVCARGTFVELNKFI